MKFLSTIIAVFLCFSYAKAQEINYQSIKGTWDYKSPKAKTTLSYKFDIDNKFTSITERKETEIKIDGNYQFDKIGDLDRLILTTANKEDGTKTQMLYHFIKFIATDTIKIQQINDKQTVWLQENKRNTMIFIRKKEKPKKQPQ